MAPRYLSPFDSVTARIKELPPLSFQGKSLEEFQDWRVRFKAKLLKFLGDMPPKVPMNPEILETKDMGTYTREKIIIDADKYDSIPLYLLVPKKYQKESQPLPAILAAHGHGRGKIDVCGIVKNKKEYKKNIVPLNYDYAVQFVNHGFIVISPDWRGFGERSSPSSWVRKGRDPCNVNYMAYGYCGYQLLALDIWDGMCCIDYLQSRREVDPNRIGCAGLSFGGTMTTYLTMMDERVKVACISGYLSTLQGDAFSTRANANFCGSQYMQGLLTIGDIPDVAGLIAPRPLMIEIGKKDTCFIFPDALNAYNHLKSIYKSAGAEDKLDCDIFPGDHQWSGVKSLPWFKKYL
jgi:dienelactone hydrolase